MQRRLDDPNLMRSDDAIRQWEGAAAMDNVGTGGPARRVLVVNRVGYLGGVERIILTLADSLDAFGWHPVLACPDDGPLAQAARAQGTVVAPCGFDRMRITPNPLVLARYPLAMKQGAADILRRCRETKPDLIHVHHPVTALYALPAAWRLRIPIVLHVHETLPAKRLYALALRAVLPRVASVLCVSKAALALATAMGADPAQARVVHNGVDERFLHVTQATPPAMVQAAGPGPHVGVFGVLEPRKAQHVLLEAAASLAAEFPTAHFWLVGPAAQADKQAYADRLQAMAAAEPLHGRVTLAGFQADMIDWLSAMDLVVQPSVAYESFGMSLAEALTLGRPVVAARTGGMPEVVVEGQTGLIVPPGDAAALAEALRTLLHSPERRAAFGAQGAADARARFSPEVFRRHVTQAYGAVLRQNRKVGGETYA